MVSSTIGGPVPLLGREAERRLVAENLLGKEARGVVLCGEPGVGKSRLAAEAVAEAAGRGADTEMIFATRSSASVPFGAFVHLARHRRSLPSRTELLVDLVEAIVDRAARATVVVSVDDAHLLDEGAAAVIQALVARRACRLLLTVRAGAEVPDAVTALWKDERLLRIDLQPLEPAALNEFTELFLRGPVDSATRHRLVRWCAGSPLLLRELLLSGAESGALTQREGVWRWTGQAVINDRLTAVVGARLDSLTARQRRLLEAVAVAEPVSVAALHHWGGEAAVEALERRGLVTAAASGQDAVARLGHPLYGELIRARISPLARRRLLSALADELLAQARPAPDDWFRAALWRTESGGRVDPGLLVSAAGHAASLFSYELAARLARRAVALGAGPPARLLLGLSLYWMSQYQECCDVLAAIDTDEPTESTELAEPTEPQRAEAANIHSAALFWGLDQIEAAQALLEQVTSAVTQPQALANLRSQAATFLAWSGRPAAAEAVAPAVIEDPAAGPVHRVRATIALALSMAVDGRTEQAVRLTGGALDEAMAHGAQMPLAAGELLAVQAAARWLGSDVVAAIELAAGVSQWCLEHNEESMRGIFTLIEGQSRLASGDIDAAARLLRESIACLSEADPARAAAWAWAAAAAAHAQAGDGASAHACALQARPAARRATALLDPLIAWGEAWALACDVSASAAAAALIEAAAATAGRGMRAVEVLLLLEATRLGGARLAEARLGVLAAELGTPAAAAAYQFACGARSHDAGLLSMASEAFSSLGAVLVAAEAAMLASHEYRMAGRKSSAATLASRSRFLLARCPGARPPTAAFALNALSDPLTRREREIALLAARGLSSPAMARRLDLSVRTVENHLARIYFKLGVQRRSELGTLFEEAD